jgi:hypothetical protein
MSAGTANDAPIVATQAHELTVDVPAHDRILVAFAELTLCR